MQPILTCAEVRAREQRAIQELGLPSLLLMENAGRGCADLLRSLGGWSSAAARATTAATGW
jgi:NAD(P)H-hydrate epimerase